jgi:outer membrane protein OmpA-like peptidoglycan-associated protein
MKFEKVTLFFSFLFLIFLSVTAQTSNSNSPKDAKVEVTMLDFKSVPVPHEIMIFKSKNFQKEYQGLSDSLGRFSLRLPAGDVYQYYTLNTTDSTLYKELEIPALKENFSYKAPFVITFYLDAPKNFILEGLNFDNGKYSFQPSAYPVMDDLVEYMKRKEDDRIEIGGHTDNVGNAKSNLKLSEDRANAVKEYLVAHGIDSSRLLTKGYGSSKPIESNNTPAGRAENRRTEVTILE